MTVRVTLYAEDLINLHDLEVLSWGISKSVQEVGGEVRSWTDLETSLPVYELQSRPRDLPLYGLRWRELE